MFENAHLTWNEADGCGDGSGPTCRLKLKAKPLGPVEVFIKDPDDNYRSTKVTKGRLGRLYIENSAYWGDEDSKIIMRFTLGNWDNHQLVN